MRRIGIPMLALTLAIGAAAIVPSANAQELRSLQIARQTLTRSNGAHLGVISAYNKGEHANAALVESAAGAINRIAKALPAMFLPGTGVEAGATRAKAEIWGDWDGFLAIAQALDTESAKLVEAAKSGDAAAIAAQTTAMTTNGCGACHGKFRGPRN